MRLHLNSEILVVPKDELYFLIFLLAEDATDCVVSEWLPWGACSKTCGFGRQERHRTILKRASGRGQYCPVLREDKTCAMKACQYDTFQFLRRNG